MFYGPGASKNPPQKKQKKGQKNTQKTRKRVRRAGNVFWAVFLDKRTTLSASQSNQSEAQAHEISRLIFGQPGALARAGVYSRVLEGVDRTRA